MFLCRQLMVFMSLEGADPGTFDRRGPKFNLYKAETKEI